jgi:hypothetical protein
MLSTDPKRIPFVFDFADRLLDHDDSEDVEPVISDRGMYVVAGILLLLAFVFAVFVWYPSHQ